MLHTLCNKKIKETIDYCECCPRKIDKTNIEIENFVNKKGV